MHDLRPDTVRDESSDITAKIDHFPYSGRTEIGILGIGHDEHRFQPFIDFLHEQGPLEFIFEIRESPQPPYDEFCALLFTEFIQQTGKTGYPYIGI